MENQKRNYNSTKQSGDADGDDDADDDDSDEDVFFVPPFEYAYKREK